MITDESADLIRRQRLNDADLAAIHDLAAVCNRFDGLDLKLNWDMLQERPGTVTEDFLFHQGGALIGYLALYGFGRPVLELNGMVHPDHRRSRIFSQLFNAARAEAVARSIAQLLLICEPDSVGGQALVRAIGAHYVFAEHKMVIGNPVRLLAGTSPIRLELVDATNAQLAARINAQSFGHTADEAESWTGQYVAQRDRRAYLARLNEEPLGAIAVNTMGEEAFIYGFGVVPELRGRGYGRQILAATINILVEEGDRPIMLEVETENQNALGLYESCGFKRARTYEYWGLPVRP